MTRELKLALIVGFALVLTVAILVSDHLSKARNATLANVTGTSKVEAKIPDMPIRSPEDVLPPSATASAVTPDKPVAPPEGEIRPETKVAMSDPAPAEPVVIGQASSGPHRETKFGPGALQVGLVETKPSEAKPQTTVPAGTPQDIVKHEIAKKDAPKAAEKTHKIAEGDSLYSISKKYYNDGSLWKKLAAANSGKVSENGSLKVGSVINIPAKETLTGKPEVAKVEPKAAKQPAKPETKSAKAEEAKIKSYQVRPGDTLTNIARAQLGSPGRSSEIASLNRMDPEDDLLAGAILKIPAR
ncbi:MAG: LysM peptidoglycan-binding domain-containing protein [Phycisphaerales bacterium]|nr:LysM peptidoglycan-binding domain-containing protein [Planctomycetota bacterium]